MLYRFKTKCPRCGAVGEITVDHPAPAVSCGDCLFDRTEVVHLDLTLIETKDETRT